MRLVVDAVGVRPGSAAIVIENILVGWLATTPEDEIIVLCDGDPPFMTPPRVRLMRMTDVSASVPTRLWAQSVGVRRCCNRLDADALLSATTAGSLFGASCVHGAIVYDLRHELRPDQFSVLRRIARRLLYGWTFRRAQALFCISERTRTDLVARRPSLRDKTQTTLLGANHASAWRRAAAQDQEYVLAFGHFVNKNVRLVLDAWQIFAAQRPDMHLRICGLSATARSGIAERVNELGVGPSVQLLPWLSDVDFTEVFAGAAAILMPSDFEGFGLPAVEALLLGIPVVISRDPALLEVTAGHAVAFDGDDKQDFADAIGEALDLDMKAIAAGVLHARTFTWERTARQMRDAFISLQPVVGEVRAWRQ